MILLGEATAAATCCGITMNPTLATWLSCPTFWGLVAGAIGLFLLLPYTSKWGRGVGIPLCGLAFVLLVVDQLRVQKFAGEPIQLSFFWLAAAIAVGGGVGTITARSPVYSAIWFALSLLGVAALFLLQHAHFLGVATIIVYAGAIVVTFLFVLMLAQPEGHSVADRISWGLAPKLGGVILAGALVGLVANLIHETKLGSARDQVAASFSKPGEFGPRLMNLTIGSLESDNPIVTLTLRGSEEVTIPEADVTAVLQLKDKKPEYKVSYLPVTMQSEPHMAQLGGYLFSRHLIAVELAGTLLLVALVGAIGMMIQGKLIQQGASHE